MQIEKYQKLQSLALKSVEGFPKSRFLFNELLLHRSKAFVGVVGPRGVGKTVLLRQLARDIDDAFYLSLDTFEDLDLFEFSENLYTAFGIRTLLLDEVHFYKDISGALKKIYDFLDLKVIFTSSVSLLMIESAHDLSRRVLLKSLPPLSFREYVYFKEGQLLPHITLTQIINGECDPGYLQYEHLFQNYLCSGNFIFTHEVDESLEALGNVIKKIIQQDIPRVSDISFSEIDNISRCFSFIGKSGVDGINPSSISNNLKITKYKAEQYLSLLEQAFLIQQIFPSGTNVLREPKVLMLPPYRLLYSPLEKAIGGLREDFAAQMIGMVTDKFSYLKSERGKKCPDFLLSLDNRKIVIEIGGKSKGTEQFKGISDTFEKFIFKQSAGITRNERSLSLLGFLY
jgi:predicted AAA+ superfamily ATPase